MSFSVYELAKAKADKRAIFRWLLEQSRQGANAWLHAYDKALHRLSKDADSFRQAFENESCPDADVRQIFFKTRRGRFYRVLFLIEDTNVFVLRVRGPGQASVNADELT